MATALTGAVQECLLCLLCWDEDKGRLVPAIVPLGCWDTFYREIASKAYNYWQKYDRVPGEHFIDLVDELVAQNPKDEPVYRKIYLSIIQTKNNINAEYVLDKAVQFARQQQIKTSIMRVVDFIQTDQLDAAERELVSGLKTITTSFDPGITLTDDAAFGFFRKAGSSYMTGIPELDYRNIGPARGELLLFIAPMKRGKSWFIIHVGKTNLIQRKKILHISLEMSEEQVAQRYLQGFFAVTTRPQSLIKQTFEKDEMGRFLSLQAEEIPDRPSLRDPGIENWLRSKAKSLRMAPNLLIKNFPTGSLTIPELEGFLDLLEDSKKFIPDIILMDYIDLMKIDSASYRHDLGALYKNIRGIAGKRNLAVVTVSQANKEGMESKVIRDTHVAEDVSKIATADIVLTYSQTESEKKLGLARLFVSNCRSEEDGFTIIISQNYALGQFCNSSVLMQSRYWDYIPKDTNK